MMIEFIDGDEHLAAISQWEREHSRYFIRRDKEPWREVSEMEFIAAEREAGFFPKAGCGPIATAGFGFSGNGKRIEGRIEYADLPTPS